MCFCASVRDDAFLRRRSLLGRKQVEISDNRNGNAGTVVKSWLKFGEKQEIHFLELLFVSLFLNVVLWGTCNTFL